jgi:hypothetical protein
VRRIPLKKTVALASAAVVLAGGGAAIAEARRGGDGAASSFLDAVAKHLGVSRERLDEATKAAALEQVDAAREAGRITEEQADALEARIEAGETPPFFGPFFGGAHGGMPHFGVDLAAAAEYLGVSEAELRGRLALGESLADVAEAEGKSVDGLKEALVADAEERLDEAVDDGMLTEEQAKTMLDRLRSRVDALVEGELPRWRGHRGGPPGFPGAFPDPRGMRPPERAA